MSGLRKIVLGTLLLSCAVADAAPQVRSVKETLLRQWPGNARLNIPEVKKNSGD